MAFIGKDFIPGSSQANGFKTASYSSSSDDLATIKGSGYFNQASAKSGGWGLNDGDFILVTASDGAAFLQMGVTSLGVASVTSDNDFS